MRRLNTLICLVAVISLLSGVIWQGAAQAAVAPQIVPLGQIKDGLSSPGRLAVDGAGNLYVADVTLAKVVEFDKYGKLVRTIASVPVSGTGLAVTADGSRIYVANMDSVSVVDGTTGKVVGMLGQGAGEFTRVWDIKLDAKGFVFVADSGVPQVRVYDPQGAFQYAVGSKGTGSGLYQEISSMAVDAAAGQVWVSDSATVPSNTPEVQVYDLAGSFQRSLTAASAFGTSVVGAFGGMAFDSQGRAYVADFSDSNLRILGPDFTYLSTLSSTASGLGQLGLIQDVAYDGLTNRLYVACDGMGVQVFGIDGAVNPLSVNHAPGLPVPFSPVGESVVTTNQPQLQFHNAVDPDGDVLTYDVQVLQGSTVVAQYASQPAGAADTSVQVTTPLQENALYSWQVRASDGTATSAWTDPQSFYVNAVNKPPTAPALLSPLKGETLDGQGQFSWQAATDPDPLDSVSYRLEIATDAGFSAPVVSQPVSGTSVQLGTLSGVSQLQDGASYFWRVVAVDASGLETPASNNGSFVYDTTLLQVGANMPGARVYLGGNLGFAGRYVGKTPLELRDFPVGPCSVVVERAGFEPFVAQVDPALHQNVSVQAVLRPALVPTIRDQRVLGTEGGRIFLGGDAAPYLVDFDNDGRLDLLVGDASGALTLFPGLKGHEDDGPLFGRGVVLNLKLTPGAVPFVADWNNDGRKDLLVGGADGTVSLYLNVGTEAAPTFGDGAYLQVAGAPLNVGADAAPAVVDFDGDGAKDLVVGDAAGDVYLYHNVGSDAVPQFDAAQKLLTVQGGAVPFFADWNGDGQPDLLVSAGGQLLQAVRQADGSYQAQVLLNLGGQVANFGDRGDRKDLKGTRRQAASHASTGGVLHIFVADVDGMGGKDLLVGNGGGQVLLAFSRSHTLCASFYQAVGDKLTQVGTALAKDAPGAASLLTPVETAVQSRDLAAAGQAATALAAALPQGSPAAGVVAELQQLLQAGPSAD